MKREEERLETQHDLILRFCGNRLFFPRINNPRKILECGYGRGDWAVAVAEEYEDCEVCPLRLSFALLMGSIFHYHSEKFLHKANL